MLAWLAAGCTVHEGEIKSADSAPKQMDPKFVRVDWKFAAPPAKIWEAWTEPHVVRQWFGSDPNGEVLDAFLDVRPGGSFEVTFANGDGTPYTASGVYKKVEPHRLLKFSWGWRNEPGIETAITVALFADGTGTRMQFEHAGLIHASSHDYASGWRSTFAKMERAVASSTEEVGPRTRIDSGRHN
jgi:uncharacterized protein YndB with AHSA1/START domain